MEWFDVPGYSPLQITKCGRVRAKTYLTKRGKSNLKLVTLINHEFTHRLSASGYLKINYKPNGERKPLYVHRLVALTFVEGYRHDLQVNHKNGNKLDVRPENLEWISCAENVVHAWENSLATNWGETASGAKLTEMEAREIKRLALAGEQTRADIARQFGVSVQTVNAIGRGTRWAHLN